MIFITFLRFARWIKYLYLLVSLVRMVVDGDWLRSSQSSWVLARRETTLLPMNRSCSPGEKWKNLNVFKGKFILERLYRVTSPGLKQRANAPEPGKDRVFILLTTKETVYLPTSGRIPLQYAYLHMIFSAYIVFNWNRITSLDSLEFFINFKFFTSFYDER